MCPLRPASLSPRDGRAKVLQAPPEPPRICTQTAITIAPDAGARYRQDLPYGSPAWHARYATLRNTIEGLNGYAKDPAHQALAQPFAAASAASPPSRCSPPCCWPPPTSACLAGTHPHQRNPDGHGGAGPAWATTSPTANTRTSPQRHHRSPSARPVGHAPATRKAPSTQVRRRPEPGHAATMRRCQTPAAYSKTGHRHSSVGITPAVLSVTPG